MKTQHLQHSECCHGALQFTSQKILLVLTTTLDLHVKDSVTSKTYLIVDNTRGGRRQVKKFLF